MDTLKTTYIRAVILKNDILSYHQELNDTKNWNKKLQFFKNCFVALDILRDSFHYFNGIMKDRKDLTIQARDLKKRLQFANHIRNKISGHLEEILLEKAIQWEPFIFSKGIKSNIEGQLFLIYKTLLESAINSYVDEESNQKVFNTKIDLLYPPNQTLFFNYIGELNLDSISFLTKIEVIAHENINYWDNDQMIEMAIKAGNTNFKLKK